MTEYSVEVIAGDTASITSVTGAATLEVTIDNVMKIGTVNEISSVEVIIPGPVVVGAGGINDPAPLEAHRVSLTPHPHYDDLPSLQLTFENGLI